MQGGRAKKSKMVEQMQDGGAEVKQKMQDGRSKKCKAVEQKLNKKMQDGRAKKCKMD
jgi:hypothetical protein